jgi:hypothetical protein
VVDSALVAHQYGALDWRRDHALASSDLGDLEAFCATIARLAGGSGPDARRQ